MGLKIISPNTVYLGSATGSGGGGGGSSSLPIIVKNSGSSLPSASSYSIGDKFLQTNEKKIYTPVINGYITNTNTTIFSNVTVDYNTGIVSNIPSQANCYRRSVNWDSFWNSSGNSTKSFSFKFKVVSLGYNPIVKLDYASQSGPYASGVDFFMSSSDNYKIHHSKYSYSYSSYTTVFDKAILDTILEVDTVYILNIQKTGTDCIAQLTLEDGTVIEEKTFTTEDLTFISGYATAVYYGRRQTNTMSDRLEIYLVDSYGDLLIPNTSTLSWDSGTDLVNNTEYADKTNGILYLYENNELLAINKPNSFAQITGQPTDNSNLATALNNKQNKALSFTNKSASSWVADNTYTDYGYKCELSCSGVTSSMYAMVNFAPTEADSGNYATVAQTGNNIVTIYSKVNDTITIPNIVVMGV